MVATVGLTALQNLKVGAWLEAEVQAREALAVAPDDPQALLLLGLAIAAMGEATRAAPVLDHVARMMPAAPHPCQDLAALEPPLPLALVRRQFHACLRLAPRDTRLRLAFSTFLLNQDLAAEAEAVLADAVPAEAVLAEVMSKGAGGPAGAAAVAVPAGAPESAAVRHMIGLAQAEQGHFKTAIASFSRAVALDPDAAASWSNLGIVLKIEDRFVAAIQAHDRAVSLDPANPTFRINRAVALLKAGHWEKAWQDYEWRLKAAGGAPVDLNRLLPSVAALGDLRGRTIIAVHEEGFGDTLQFLRYLPLLAERGARVLACVPQPLVRLLATVPGVADVIDATTKWPEHDFVCPFFSLPRAFATTTETIPPTPRLRPDAELARQWRLRLPRDGMLVGLVWAGQARPWLPGFRTLDRRRSSGLSEFEPLSAVATARFVSLQLGPAAQQAPPPGMTLIKPLTPGMDFAETAAIVSALDVVVSVDTSVVHLAGLLRKPVFLLDRYDGCWRWLSGKRDSAWYPNLTIFRQDRPGDWAAPMARVAASLHAMALFKDTGDAAASPVDLQEPALMA